MEAQPPEQVQDAFSDAIRAREDEQRYINEAEAYRNEIIPLARGEAKQIIEEAKAYKVKIIKSAEGEAIRFNNLYREYEKAPQVTRERLYIETVESVLANTSKVMIDVEGGNNLLYLPLDKLMDSRSTKPGGLTSTIEPDTMRNSLSDKIRNNRDSFNSRKRNLYSE